MSLRKTIFAAIYDPMSRAGEEAGVRDMRHGLLAEAGGSVLEIGAGTGANLAHYDDNIESLVLTEPEPAMLRRLQRKAREQAPQAEVVQAPAEDLPFEDDEFRHRRLDARTLRRRRPGTVAARDRPCPPAGRPPAVPRARALG